MKVLFKKLILLFFCLNIVTACGVNTDYLLSIDESTKAVDLNIDIKVNASDYQHIEGGKNSLIESINTSKPEIYHFSTSSQKEYDIYNFKAYFENFEQFENFYNSISVNELSSEVISIPFSKESLLKSTYSIQLNDSMDVLMDWLIQDLLNSGKIESSKKDSLIKSSNSYISLSNNTDKNSKSIKIEERVGIDQISVFMNIKRNGIIDLQAQFNAKGTYPDFKRFLDEYLVDSKSSINLFLNQDNDTYKLVANSLDLKNEDTLSALKNILGKSFLTITHKQTVNKKTIQNDVTQNILLNFDTYNFLDANENIPIKLHINYDKDLVHDEVYDIDISEFDNTFSINSKYTTTKTGPIVLLFTSSILSVLIMLLILKKYKNNEPFKFKVDQKFDHFKTILDKILKEILKHLKKLSQWIKFKDLNPNLSVSNNLIENGNYAISINSISIITFQKLWDYKAYIARYFISSSIIITALIVHIRWLSLVLIVLIVIYLFFITIRRESYILTIQSTCGTEDSLFYSKDTGFKQYCKIIKQIKGEKNEN